MSLDTTDTEEYVGALVGIMACRLELDEMAARLNNITIRLDDARNRQHEMMQERLTEMWVNQWKTLGITPMLIAIHPAPFVNLQYFMIQTTGTTKWNIKFTMDKKSGVPFIVVAGKTIFLGDAGHGMWSKSVSKPTEWKNPTAMTINPCTFDFEDASLIYWLLKHDNPAQDMSGFSYQNDDIWNANWEAYSESDTDDDAVQVYETGNWYQEIIVGPYGNILLYF